jgi:hypothetical protein
MDGKVLSVERVIPSSREAIFALLSDASRHHDIDGSGTVMAARSGAAEPLGPGATFGMSMRVGLPYSTVNTVIEYEENRRIAWQTTIGGIPGRLAGGRIWRYELEPAEGGTRVRESWDISQDKQASMLKLIAARRTRTAMEKTLERIEELTRGS